MKATRNTETGLWELSGTWEVVLTDGVVGRSNMAKKDIAKSLTTALAKQIEEQLLTFICMGGDR